jgi:hypothetical protein
LRSGKLVELERDRPLADTVIDLLLGKVLEPQGEPHVLARRHVRLERVVPEDGGDVTLAWVKVVDDLVADPDLARADRLEPGQYPQRRALPASGRSGEYDELAVGDVEAQVGEGVLTVLVSLGTPTNLTCATATRPLAFAWARS